MVTIYERKYNNAYNWAMTQEDVYTEREKTLVFFSYEDVTGKSSCPSPAISQSIYPQIVKTLQSLVRFIQVLSKQIFQMIESLGCMRLPVCVSSI